MADVIVNAELTEKEAAKLALMATCPKCEAEKGEPCRMSGGRAHFLRHKAAATKVLKRILK